MGAIENIRTALRRLILIGLPLFAIYNYFYPWSGIKERSLFALILLAAVYLSTNGNHRSVRWLVFDTINLLISLVVFGYTFLSWQGILGRVGSLSTTDMFLGVLGAYVAIVATWKMVGKPLLVVVFLFVLYVFFGQYLPATLGGHAGYSIQRIFTFMLFSENGLLGYIIGVTLKYVLVFLLLGQVLQKTGALDFIMDLSRVIFRRGGRSGPALMSVFSSGLVGSIIGAAVANVFVTGNVTIPLMKRVGVKPELAAATEAAASTGGQIMPPVMGFAAFFIVQLLGIPYIEVVKAAWIPAVLYFLAVGVAVYFRTRGKTVGDHTWGDNTLRFRDVFFRVSTITFVGTIGILITLLIMHVSLQMAALWATLFAFLSSLAGRNRITPKKAVAVLEDAGNDTLSISVASLILGLIAGAVLLTGLGGKIPTLLIGWADGNLIPLLFFTMLASLVLGVGVPTSIAYLIVAITVSSSLTQLGVPILHAHLFVFYSAMAAMVTPPVALAAYAGATIAKANFWKTGLLAFVIGLPALLVPFAFIFRPGLMMVGSSFEILSQTLLTAIGLSLFIASLGIQSKTTFEILGRVTLGRGRV